MNLLSEINKRVFVLDGAMGTMIQEKGVNVIINELLNIENPEIIERIHKAYVDAGADIITTNTFSANRIKLSEYGLENKVKEINEAGIAIAKKVAGKKALVAASVSYCGKYIQPLGELSFDEAYENFAEQIKYCKRADVLLIETIVDLKDLRAALIAAKDYWKKPVFCSMTFEGDKTITGTGVKSFATVAEALEADVVGINCSTGPKELFPVVKRICENTYLPVIVYPNAGIPKLVNGKTVFDLNPEEMAYYAERFVSLGANIVGGCCGTTPAHIKAIAEKTKNLEVKKRNKNGQKIIPRVCSRSKTIEFLKPLIIGESINPTNKKELSEELNHGKTSFIRKLAVDETKAGADILDVNVCTPQCNEEEMLAKAVRDIEASTDSPLCLDSKNPIALEKALKEISGKAIINSVDGEQKNIEKILPLAKKYGAMVIALTLDEKGIPKSANERVQIAEKILKEAKKMGLKKEDILVDALTITLAVNEKNAEITLDAVKRIKALGVKTVLGVSNISHGLPNRRQLNFSFLVDALENGLDAAIMNPFDEVTIEAIKDVKQFEGKKPRAIEEYFERFKEKKILDKRLSIEEQLKHAIIDGLEEEIEEIIVNALKKLPAIKVNDLLIDGMNVVGERFKKKEIFLPSVLFSASAMKKAFKVLEKKIEKTGEKNFRIVFATVKNDIHDLGKNIVIALLESYGFKVIDLGTDVSKEKIVETVKKENAGIVCLSALMTTTIIEMPKVIQALRESELKVPVMLGGAIVNREFAEQCNAIYAKDAIDAVEKIKEIAN